MGPFIATLANAATAQEMWELLDNFQKSTSWYNRTCVFLKDRLLSLSTDDIFALSNRINTLVQEYPELMRDPQVLQSLGQIHRKLTTGVTASILMPRLCREMTQQNSLVLSNLNIIASDLKMLIDQCDLEKISSVKGVFKEEDFLIPLEVIRQACLEYPQKTFKEMLEGPCAEKIFVSGQNIFVTNKVIKLFFNIPEEFSSIASSDLVLPEVNPDLVLLYINALIAPQRYPQGLPKAFVSIDKNGQIQAHPWLKDLIILNDFLHIETRQVEIRDCLLNVLNKKALAAQNPPSYTQVEIICRLVDFVELHEASLDKVIHLVLKKHVELFLNSKEGITIDLFQKLLKSTRIPFDELMIKFTTSEGMFFSAFYTKSAIGEKKLPLKVLFFCCCEEEQLLFLPRLFRDSTEVIKEIKTKELTFLLSDEAASDPVWEQAMQLDTHICMDIALTLEDTKPKHNINGVMELFIIAHKSKNRGGLYNAALSYILMYAQKRQEILKLEVLESLLSMLAYFKEKGISKKDLTYFYDTVVYMTQRLLKAGGIPEKVIEDYTEAYGQKFPNYTYPRNKVIQKCKSLEVSEVNITVNASTKDRALEIHEFFPAIETIVLDIEPDTQIFIEWFEPFKDFKSLKTLRIKGAARFLQDRDAWNKVTKLLSHIKTIECC